MRRILQTILPAVVGTIALLGSVIPASAWGTGVISGPGGCEFAGYSQVDSSTFSWSETGACPAATTTGVRIEYWTGSSWVYKNWVLTTTDYADDSIGTQYMNGYHKIQAYSTWSSVYWTTD